mgnify:CR=1 FL=1
MKNNKKKLIFKLNLKYLDATYESDTNKVRLRGKFYKSRNDDMPTMLWFPEVFDLAENYDKWLNNPNNDVKKV